MTTRRLAASWTLLLWSSWSLACGNDASAPRGPQYPQARTVPVVDDYHGTKVADPYRWLEELDSSEVRDFAAAQNALFESIVRKAETRPLLLARIDELGMLWDSAENSAPPEPPLIDDKSLGPGRTLDEAWRAPDQQHIVYTVSNRGSEWVDLRIRRVADGADLSDSFEPMLWTDAVWTRDNRGFFYVRHERPVLNERTTAKNPAVYYHLIGTPQAEDTAIFTTPPGTTDLVVTIQEGGDGRYLFVSEGNGAHEESIGWLLSRMHVLDLGDPGSPSITNRLASLTGSRDAAYRVAAVDGHTLFLLTDRQAPRRRLVAVDLRRPAPEHWRDVIPESQDVIDGIQRVGRRWVVGYVRNVQHVLKVFDATGRLVSEPALPPMRRIVSAQPGKSHDEHVITSTGWTTSPERARFNLATGKSTVEHRGTEMDFDVEHVWYPSKDGVRIPMYLIHRRGLVKDGSHPLLIHGYGASSQLELPVFHEGLMAAVELGFVVAVPALRGGGEFGRDWYEAATLGRKQTTFDDFIAAVEYLVAQGFTSVGKIAIQGKSNGGLLVSAAITQRPDLFRAAVAEVPLTDAIRFDRGRHLTQFGSPANPGDFRFLYAYSPQHRIKPGTCYPSTLITTSFNDDRVPAWLPLKFTAALQAAQGCANPILLRVSAGGGHEGDFMEDAADAVAFIARELGVPPRQAGR